VNDSTGLGGASIVGGGGTAAESARLRLDSVEAEAVASTAAGVEPSAEESAAWEPGAWAALEETQPARAKQRRIRIEILRLALGTRASNRASTCRFAP
jgi:hypothetical protein